MNIAKLVAVTSVVLLISFGSNAQTPEQPAAWRVECTGDGKVLDCRAVQQLFQRDTRHWCFRSSSVSRQMRRPP